MSDLGYSVMDIANKRYALYVKSKDLFHPNRVIHERVLPLFKSELMFYNTVGRLACAVAELKLTSREDVDVRLSFTILMMVGYLTDTLSCGHKGASNPDIPLCVDHVVNSAIQLAALMPQGVWSDIHCTQLDQTTVVYEGVMHDQDYR